MVTNFFKAFLLSVLLLSIIACGDSSPSEPVDHNSGIGESSNEDEEQEPREGEGGTSSVRFDIAGSAVLQTFDQSSSSSVSVSGLNVALNNDEAIGDFFSSNLIAIDTSGESRVAIESDLPVSVSYTMLSHDGEWAYLALDGYVGETNDYNKIIATLNCGLLAVNVATNEFDCISEGIEVESMPASIYEINSVQERPLLIDELGNLYFAGVPFGRECDEETGICVMAGHGDHRQIYKYDIAESSLTSLTGEVPGLFSFQVLSNDRLIWYIPDNHTDHGYDQLYLFDQGNVSVIDSPEAWSQFFLTDDESSVVFTYPYAGFGHGANFAEINEAGDIKRTTLDLYGFKLDDRFTHNNNVVFRFVRGDDDALYGMFVAYDQYSQEDGNTLWKHNYNAFRLLPYDPEPLYQVVIPEGTFESETEDNYAMSHTMPIIVKENHTYYLGVDINDAGDGFFTLNVTEHQLPTSKVLLGADEDFAPRFYRWRLVEDLIYFTGRNLVDEQYFLGTIDTAKVVAGDNDFLVLDTVDTLGRGQATLRDFEVLSTPSQIEPKDTPPQVNLLTTLSNPYSVTLQFDRPMNRESVNDELTLMYDTGAEIPFARFWLGNSLHLIPDQSTAGLNEYGGQPLTPDRHYELHLGSAVTDRWGNELPDAITKSFYLDHDTGWVIQEHSVVTSLPGVSEGGFARYQGENAPLEDGQNPDWPMAHYQVKDADGTPLSLPANFQLEFSARQLLGWGSINFRVRSNDDENEVLHLELHDDMMQVVYDAPGFGGVGAKVEETDVYTDVWRRYRFELVGEQIRFLTSDDGENFIELSDIEWPVMEDGSEPLPRPRESTTGYEVLMDIRTPFMMDNLTFRALDEHGEIEEILYQQNFDELETNQLRNMLNFIGFQD